MCCHLSLVQSSQPLLLNQLFLPKAACCESLGATEQQCLTNRSLTSDLLLDILISTLFDWQRCMKADSLQWMEVVVICELGSFLWIRVSNQQHELVLITWTSSDQTAMCNCWLYIEFVFLGVFLMIMEISRWSFWWIVSWDYTSDFQKSSDGHGRPSDHSWMYLENCFVL